MNKHEIVFDMLKDKILFVFKRYKYNDNKILTFKNLSFLLKILFIIIIRSFKFIVENKSNENNFDMNYFKDISNRKRSILTFKALKEKMIKKFNFIDIVKINASIYYYLTRNKKKQALFFNNEWDLRYF